MAFDVIDFYLSGICFPFPSASPMLQVRLQYSSIPSHIPLLGYTPSFFALHQFLETVKSARQPRAFLPFIGSYAENLHASQAIRFILLAHLLRRVENKMKRKNCFFTQCITSSMWSLLPQDVVMAASLDGFKRELHKFTGGRSIKGSSIEGILLIVLSFL